MSKRVVTVLCPSLRGNFSWTLLGEFRILGMTRWFLSDRTGHRRGPFAAGQISLLIHLGSIDIGSSFREENKSEWKQMTAHESLQSELADALTSTDGPRDTRLSLATVPYFETTPCQDPTCPNAPSCDLVYIWDRKEKMWLSFREYEQLCREEGLTDGLPERAVAETADQISELLRQTDDALAHASGSKRNHDDDEGDDLDNDEKRKKRKAYRERRRLRREAGVWVKSTENPNIYISSLPEDTSKEELLELFKKAGQLKADLKTGEPRVKLYGHGDALITFMHFESVNVAIDLFNGYEFRPGCFISVQEADFKDKEASQLQMSLEELREKAQVNRDSRKRLLAFYRKQRALDSTWDLADYQVGNKRVRKVVVLQNCFDPRSEQSIDYRFIEERMEQICLGYGDIKKVIAIKDSLDGFVCVKFETADSAENCVAAIDSAIDTPERFSFQDRPLTAFIHDGRDLYSRVHVRPEPEEELQEQRELQWESFLYEEVDSDDDDIQIRTE